MHVSTRRYPGRLRPATNSGPPRGEIPPSPRLRTSDEKRHAPPSRMRVLHSQEENSGHTLSRRVAADSACSYRTPPFQSLGAHPASEHLCSVLDPDRFGRESAMPEYIAGASPPPRAGLRVALAPRRTSASTLSGHTLEDDQKSPQSQNGSKHFDGTEFNSRSHESTRLLRDDIEINTPTFQLQCQFQDRKRRSPQRYVRKHELFSLFAKPACRVSSTARPEASSAASGGLAQGLTWTCACSPCPPSREQNAQISAAVVSSMKIQLAPRRCLFMKLI